MVSSRLKELEMDMMTKRVQCDHDVQTTFVYLFSL